MILIEVEFILQIFLLDNIYPIISCTIGTRGLELISIVCCLRQSIVTYRKIILNSSGFEMNYSLIYNHRRTRIGNRWKASHPIPNIQFDARLCITNVFMNFGSCISYFSKYSITQELSLRTLQAILSITLFFKSAFRVSSIPSMSGALTQGFSKAKNERGYIAGWPEVRGRRISREHLKI